MKLPTVLAVIMLSGCAEQPLYEDVNHKKWTTLMDMSNCQSKAPTRSLEQALKQKDAEPLRTKHYVFIDCSLRREKSFQ